MREIRRKGDPVLKRNKCGRRTGFSLPKHWGSTERCVKTGGRKAEAWGHEEQKPGRVNWMWQMSFFLLRGKWCWNRKPEVRDKGERAGHYRDSRRFSCWGPVFFSPPVPWASRWSLGKAVLQLMGSLLQAATRGWARRGFLWAFCHDDCSSLVLRPSHTAALEFSKYHSLSQINPKEIVQMMIFTHSVIAC